MAKHLSVANIKTIVTCITSMDPSRITWEAICDAVAPMIGKRPTRQSLCKHKAICSAYQAGKAKDRVVLAPLCKPASLTMAAQRIQRLETELAELKIRNGLLYEQYMTIQYNAYKHGLKQSQVLEPLPRIDRERTDRG